MFNEKKNPCLQILVNFAFLGRTRCGPRRWCHCYWMTTRLKPLVSCAITSSGGLLCVYLLNADKSFVFFFFSQTPGKWDANSRTEREEAPGKGQAAGQTHPQSQHGMSSTMVFFYEICFQVWIFIFLFYCEHHIYIIWRHWFGMNTLCQRLLKFVWMDFIAMTV